jgi:hypothetical protein
MVKKLDLFESNHGWGLNGVWSKTRSIRNLTTMAAKGQVAMPRRP